MNKNLFCSMQRKLIPSQQAVDQLKERLVQSAPAGRQPIPWKYGALAACAALLIAAYPIYHTLSPTLHPVLDGGQGGYGTYEIANEDAYGEIGTELPRLNIWDTQAPSQASAHSYAAGEGVNREVTQSDLETLLGGFIPQVLGWEGFDQLSGMLAFGPGHGDPLDLSLIHIFENDKFVKADGPSITAQCLRVPVSDGHTAAVFIKFSGEKPSIEQIKLDWANFKGRAQELELPSAPKQFIHYFEEPDRPQAKLDRELEGGMAVSMGRLREDTQYDYKFVGLSHNTLRGAAGGAVLLAELLCAEGYIDHR